MEQNPKMPANGKVYTLELLREEKRQVRKQIKESSDRIRNTYQSIVAPPKQPTTKMESFMNAFDQGMAIYRRSDDGHADCTNHTKHLWFFKKKEEMVNDFSSPFLLFLFPYFFMAFFTASETFISASPS